MEQYLKDDQPPSSLWAQCLAGARAALPSTTYDTWLSDSLFEAVDGSQFTVRFPNEFAARWVREHFGEFLQDSLRTLCGRDDLRLVCVGAPAPAASPHTARPVQQAPASTARMIYISPAYTFERFVPGPSNQLAHAGARAVARDPGNPAHNPLFIYGGVGLGKTHLICAIANEIRRTSPGRRFSYVSAEQFTKLVVSAIMNQTIMELRKQYLEVDLLLMDDAQYLAGKETTQIEFFHRFNELYQSGRQIVLTSDRPPGEIAPLEERLVSRFQSGLVVDIQPPDYETRLAILQLKVRDRGASFPSDVLEYVAHNVKKNIRQLESVVNRLCAESTTTGAPIDVQMARNSVTALLGSAGAQLTPSTIAAAVAEAFSVPPSQLRGPSRKKEILVPRQVAIFLMRELTQASLQEIGQYFSGRDHSTVLNAIERIQHLQSSDPVLRRSIDELRNRLTG
jgi:chromosomal replication initiator protein